MAFFLKSPEIYLTRSAACVPYYRNRLIFSLSHSDIKSNHKLWFLERKTRRWTGQGLAVGRLHGLSMDDKLCVKKFDTLRRCQRNGNQTFFSITLRHFLLRMDEKRKTISISRLLAANGIIVSKRGGGGKCWPQGKKVYLQNQEPNEERTKTTKVNKQCSNTTTPTPSLLRNKQLLDGCMVSVLALVLALAFGPRRQFGLWVAALRM